MHPEIFEIPFIHATVKSYGLMIVIGLLAAIFVIRKLSERIGMKTVNKDYITNGALYALIAGVVGSRVFYVLHHFRQFKGNLISVFSIWEGGLELLGGVLLAIAVIFAYLLILKLPVRRYLDIVVIGIALTLGFGRIGCLLNGCCYGKPTCLPIGVHFPYGSLSYLSQVYPDLDRGRTQPYVNLPDEFFGSKDENGNWVNADPAYKYYYPNTLKPFNMLTPEEKQEVTQGKYRSLPVHPTQLYASANGFLIFGLLLGFWWVFGYGKDGKLPRYRIGRPGCTFALMFILYGILRFLEEMVRDDNPFEYAGLTISQIISIGMVAVGLALFVLFISMKNDEITLEAVMAKGRLESGQRNTNKVARSG